MNTEPAKRHDSAPMMADWTAAVRPSMLYRLSRLFGTNPDVISFAGGAPDPGLCPTEELAQAAAHTMTSGSGALQYGRDLPLLKEQVTGLMSRRGVKCNPDQISITAGGQHAMDILTRLFLNPGGEVMLEELVYTGIQQTVMPFQPKIWTIPIDPETGLDLDVMGHHLASGAKPSFLYTIPEAHNPSGVSLNQEKRRSLVEIARRNRLPVVEDDAYGFLNYEDVTSRPLRALDQEWILYLGTFSKILAPGLRLGWIVAPEALTANIHVLKQLSMLSVAPLSQHIVATYLERNDFGSHLERIRHEYALRRDATLEAMRQHFPDEVQWSTPKGGLFIWAKLPEGIDTEDVVFRAVEEENVAFIPGKAFATDANNHRYDSYMRLTFARYGEDTLVEGISRLGRLLKKIVLQG